MNMQRLQIVLMAVTRRSDVMIAVFVVAVIFMMILPMPTLLVDAMIATNMGAAVVLLMIAVYISSPLSFSAFPSVLLLTTLFRLALTITTTRLILLQADAGEIVSAFGNFVVAGNIVVGLVVFLIITLVQFIVITKGSERVAEVGARFSLDAMPGKQMSIDGDLRAGAITMEQAKARRQELEKESQLYGAMDGAMKFVKGDAIAGLVIIFVNIIGGISVGVLQNDMSMGDALQVYTILTVGDGLVAQIPALFISITAGVIVTRVTTEGADNLGADIGAQVMAQPNALLIGAALLLGFSLIPGFPTAVFIMLALVLGGIGFTLKAIESGDKGDEHSSLPAMAAAGQTSEPAMSSIPEELARSVPLMVEAADTVRAVLQPERLNHELESIRRAFCLDLGVPFPGVDFRFSEQQAVDTYTVFLQGIPVVQGQLPGNSVFVRGPVDQLDMLGIPYQEGTAFLPNHPTRWVDQHYASTLREAGVTVLEPAQLLCYHLAFVLRKYAAEFIGIQETRYLLDQMEPKYTALVQEALRVVPLQKMTDVFKRLVSEDISIYNLRAVLEALAEWGQTEKDTVLLTEYVRHSLKRLISYKYNSGQNMLPVYLLDPKLEETIRNSIRQTPTGSYLALEPAASRQMIDKIKQAVGDATNHASQPVLLTAMDIRRYVRKLIELDLANLVVLSYQELTQEITVQPLGRIDLS